MVLSLVAPMAQPALAYSISGAKSQACQGIADTSGGSCSSGRSGSEINKIITNVINLLSVVVGIVAVIMIIFGGFKFVTSGGESNSVASAKHTLMYALVGLVVVALAQLIVHFVLGHIL